MEQPTSLKLFPFIILLLIVIACGKKDKPLTQEKLKEIANTYGQFAPDDAYEGDSEFAYYGSENEWTRRQFSEASANRLYKRRGQRQLLEILDGNAAQAIELCKKRLAAEPNDPEYYYMLTLAYAQLDKLSKSEDAIKKAIELGLPQERFLAGPRSLLKPIIDQSALKNILENPTNQLVHGPMLGAVTDTGINIWFRTKKEGEVRITCFKDKARKNRLGVFSGKSVATRDYTAIVAVKGLTPNTKYYYDLEINGHSLPQVSDLSFKTYPSATAPQKFAVAFGGGAGYTPQYEQMWSTLASHDLSALLMLGDNVYIDIPEMPGPFHDYTYYRRQSQPNFRKLVQSAPVYAIWDDHDAATDDVWLGPYKDKPQWKMPLLNVFKNNWNNPAYGNEEWPGCWFQFSIADVDFFMLDGRTYRTNPFQKEKTMLGPIQKSWLFNALNASKATFKVIVSPVPWADGAKPGSNDTWSGFPKERNEIFDYLTTQKIKGVILLSADRHRTDYWKIKRTKDYPLYEFTSSKLTNIHTHDLMEGALFGYNEKCSFGKLTFDTTLDDPTITFEIFSIDNERIHTYIIKQSEYSIN